MPRWPAARSRGMTTRRIATNCNGAALDSWRQLAALPASSLARRLAPTRRTDTNGALGARRTFAPGRRHFHSSLAGKNGHRENPSGAASIRWAFGRASTRGQIASGPTQWRATGGVGRRLSRAALVILTTHQIDNKSAEWRRTSNNNGRDAPRRRK